MIPMGQVSTTAEAHLLSRCRRSLIQGNPSPSLAAELDRLFAQHQDRVYGLCLRLVGNPERARELAQDTLLVAYQKLPTFRGDASFSVWLYGIARFLCFNAIRRRGELLIEDKVLRHSDPQKGVLSHLRSQERQQLLHRCLGSLEPIEQEAVHLRYVENLPQPQISQLLKLQNSSGSRALLQRCRRKLRRALLVELDILGVGQSFMGDSQ